MKTKPLLASIDQSTSCIHPLFSLLRETKNSTRLSDKWLQSGAKHWTIITVLDHVYFVHPSTNIRISRHIDRQSTDISVDISAKCRPICQLTINRAVSLDISTDILIKHWSICRLTLDRYVGQYVDREWLSDGWLTCQSIDYRHSASISLLLLYWWL